MKNSTRSTSHGKKVVAKTYDEWRDAGLQVQKGQKSTGRNEHGVATFTRDQVDWIPDEEPSEEDYQYFMDIYGYDRDWT